MKTIALIFARGGSKGIKNKNIKPFGGIPLIAHSINLAKTIKEVSEIYVSTDSAEIKSISLKYGAKVIDRPKELAKDDTPELLAWKHSVNFLIDKGINFDCFLSLPATSPLRNSQDVISCINAIEEGKEFVITVTPSSRSPFFNMVTRNKEGFASIVNKGNYFRRQDTPETYDVTTVAYATTPQKILKTENLFSQEIFSIIIPKDRSIDIDDELDFFIAEKLMERNG